MLISITLQICNSTLVDCFQLGREKFSFIAGKLGLEASFSASLAILPVLLLTF